MQNMYKMQNMQNMQNTQNMQNLQYMQNMKIMQNTQNPQTNCKICKICRLCSRSTFLIATAAMAGGTQLFEGVHLTGGDTRSCRESSKSSVFFGGAFGNVSIIGCTGIHSERWEFPGEIMWDN